MEFDIKDTMSQMLGVVKQTVDKNWKEVKEVANQFLQNRKERFALLAELRISGDLDHEKFLSRVEDEKLIFEAELNALAAISKAVAQQAVNGAIDVFLKAVQKAVGAIL
jgi:hypothetical protein